MSIEEFNKCLCKFYVSVRTSDGNYYKNNVDGNKSSSRQTPEVASHNKRLSIYYNNLFNEANKMVNSHFKHLSTPGKITGTIHKMSLSMETIRKLYESDLAEATTTSNPHALLQTARFFYLAKFRKKGTRKPFCYEKVNYSHCDNR